MNIIIIEDDKKTAAFIMKGLEQAGFNTVHAADGKDGLFKMKTGEFDVAVIDIMLPEMDGFTVIQKLREAKIKTPVLVLSAKNSVEDKVRGAFISARTRGRHAAEKARRKFRPNREE